MIRTQIYLTEIEHDALQHLVVDTGKSQSQLIREAIDMLIEQTQQPAIKDAFSKAAGLWKNRNDLPNFNKIRKEFDRL